MTDTAFEPYEPKAPSYIGDSIYIEGGNWIGEVVLYLDNGAGKHSHITLDHDSLRGILHYVKTVGWEVKP